MTVWSEPPSTITSCRHHTQTLVAMCQELGWIVNIEKSELESKQIFDFVGYEYDLRQGKIRPTLEHWQTLNLGQAALAPHRPVISYRETSSPRLAPHEADPVAPEKSLEEKEDHQKR